MRHARKPTGPDAVSRLRIGLAWPRSEATPVHFPARPMSARRGAGALAPCPGGRPNVTRDEQSNIHRDGENRAIQHQALRPADVDPAT